MILPLALCTLPALPVQAEEPADPVIAHPAPRASWLEAWEQNLRWKFDVSGRGVFDDSGYLKSLGFFGLDLHKVFTSGSRDVATLLFQPYLTRANDLVPTPPVCDGYFFDEFYIAWGRSYVRFDRDIELVGWSQTASASRLGAC